MAQVMQLKIKAQDQATPVLKKVGNETKKVATTAQSLKPAFLAATAAFTALSVVAVKTVKAFAEQELAVKKLNDALKIAGVGGAAYSGHLQKQAAALQAVTKHGDETIITMQAQLATFGLVGTQLDEATKATLDLSSAMGIDLKASALLIGKAFAGDTATLSRYGLKIDESIPKTEKFAAVMQLVNDTMGGRAAGEAQTTSGQIAQIKNQLGDLAEVIGGNIIATIEYLTKSFGGLRTMLSEVITFLGGTTEQILAQQIKLWGELANVMQFMGEKLPSWLGGEKFAAIATGLADTQNQMKAAMADLLEDQKKSIEFADRKAAANQAAAIAKSEEAKNEKAALALDKARLKYKQQMAAAAQAAATASAIESGDAGAMAAQMRLLQERKSLIDLEGARTAEQFELLAAQKGTLESQIDAIQEAIENLANTKIGQATSAINTIGSGDMGGALQMGGTAVAGALGASSAAAGPWGLLVKAISDFTINAKDLPEKITKWMDGMIQGWLEGIPAFFEYLTGDFIEKLMTEFLPALVKHISRAVSDMGALVIRAIGTILKNLPNMIWGTFKGVIGGIWDGIKSFGKAVAGFFGFGSTPPPFAGLERILEELKPRIDELTQALETQAKDLKYELASPAGKQLTLAREYGRLGRQRNTAMDDLFEAVVSKDPEAIAAAYEDIANIQGEMINLAYEGYKLELQHLDELMAEEQKKYDAERDAIMKTIEQLRDFKKTALDAFDAVRKAIIGDQNTPEQSVAAAKAAFEAAGTPAEKASAAQDYARSLQDQYLALQQLASQGAITGDEFTAQQADILAQLDAAEASTIDQFDNLIAIQEAQLVSLDEGFASFKASMDQMREELKASLLQIVNSLDRLPEAWVGASGWSAGVSGITGNPQWGFNRLWRENYRGMRGIMFLPYT